MSEFRRPSLDALLNYTGLKSQETLEAQEQRREQNWQEVGRLYQEHLPNQEQLDAEAEEAFYQQILPWTVDFETRVLPELNFACIGLKEKWAKILISQTEEFTNINSLLRAVENPEEYQNVDPDRLVQPTQGRFFLYPSHKTEAIVYTYGKPGGPYSMASAIGWKHRESSYDVYQPNTVLRAVHSQSLIQLGEDIRTQKVSASIEEWLQQK